MSLVVPDYTYDVKDFSAGYLDSPDAADLPSGATPAAANCFLTSINKDGTSKFSKRSGARLVNPTAISSGTRVDNIYEFRREGVAPGELLTVCNGHLGKWDGATSITDLANLGMAANSPVTFDTFRNLCFVMNGTIQKLYDGADVLDVGFAAPTAAPVLNFTPPAGAGVTGTYQSLATWYDSVRDHESSPSAMGTPVAFAAEDRVHTKPAGTPPANVDKWRIYVRRTDTTETYFKLVAETPIGTGTATEAVPDTQRNLATALLAPLPNANDVPPVFAFQCNALGYRIGVQANDSFVWVSAVGDPQSQHPKDKIGVARGDGQALTTVKPIGTTILAQKGRKSWYLDGDRMPFIPRELNTSFGNHSQTSSVEAAGQYYAWDDERGPYVTDLHTSWRSLVDGRIARIVATVNRGAEIRCAHLKEATLVIWSVATGSSTRQRTLLAYNYLLGAWLPPITGLEYAALTTFQLSSGQVKLFVGDYWGRVYQYFTDLIEGVPGGTITAAVTSATTGSVTCAAAAFYTTGDGLTGMPVAVVSHTGDWQFRTIASNTGTAITIDTTNGSPWSRVPDASYTVVVGGIDWFWSTALLNAGKPLHRKVGHYVYAEFKASGPGDATIDIRARFNDTTNPLTVADTFGLSSAGWGVGKWGVMKWGASARQPFRKRIGRSFYAAQWELSNRYPNQPVEVVTFGMTADLTLGRMAS